MPESRPPPRPPIPEVARERARRWLAKLLSAGEKYASKTPPAGDRPAQKSAAAPRPRSGRD
jgi:hypothetical protein